MNNIRIRRRALGLTMKQLASIVGVTEAAISHYETGRREPDNDMLLSIANALGVTVDYLIAHEESPAPVPAKENAPGTIDDQIMRELEGADVELVREVLNFIRFRKQGAEK